MWIKACLNGGRPSPAPVTPGELATAAREAAEAGAVAVHVHPRDAGGRESLRAEDVGAAVTAIREACPGLPVGVSTGIWMTDGDALERARLIAGWRVLPDFASVNVREAGFADLVRRLHGAGVGVEAGVWAPDEVDALDGLPLLRILVEIIDTPRSEAVAAADAILRRLGDAAPPAHDKGDDGGTGTVPVLLHGEEDACWPLLEHAGALGLATRVGLEDTLVLPDGSPAGGNAELVRAGCAMWTAARRKRANTDG
ncbi:3-keto-5-aminohexanoate cleavage protein [Paractinoplanes deccanensis]|uniref:3-keto-5-aminohexanoate cleavage protein n=1 Tax=Paractinoplanes deccanensis TaxID=113561 RepID=UPI001EF32C9D|nr:3-keto-5-aminohexanoate cleavage protein [Actinoplanes deccanensis]